MPAQQPPINPSAPAQSAAAEPWTIRRLLQWISGALQSRQIESPKLLAELLLTHTLACQRIDLYTHANDTVANHHLDQLRSLVKRALNHEPIQYLVGQAWFLGLPLTVDPRVLIPRPATETLVEELLQDARQRNLLEERPRERAAIAERAIERDLARARAESGEAQPAPETTPASPTPASPASATRPPLLIADIGTGSGAIALAILHAAMNARVLAVDISADALAVARANATALKLTDRLTLALGDLTAPVPAWLKAQHAHALHPSEASGLDYLVSNPPYIPDSEWNTPGLVDPNVKGHEPEHALRGGDDGLRFVQPIIEAAPALLKPTGRLLIEIASATADAAIAIAQKAGLQQPRVINDLEGLPRVLIAQR